MKNWKKLAEKMLKNMDRQKWIVCILIGVLLLVIAIPVDSKKQDAGTQESVQTTETESSSYVEQMERELEDLLGQMDGVGAVRVMITLEDQGENVVAQDISSQSSTTKEGETTKEEMSSDRRMHPMRPRPLSQRSVGSAWWRREHRTIGQKWRSMRRFRHYFPWTHIRYQ